jgi:hypothetical protein
MREKVYMYVCQTYAYIYTLYIHTYTQALTEQLSASWYQIPIYSPGDHSEITHHTGSQMVALTQNDCYEPHFRGKARQNCQILLNHKGSCRGWIARARMDPHFWSADVWLCVCVWCMYYCFVCGLGHGCLIFTIYVYIHMIWVYMYIRYVTWYIGVGNGRAGSVMGVMNKILARSPAFTPFKRLITSACVSMYMCMFMCMCMCMCM